MAYRTKNSYEIEDHPFGPFILDNTERLIIGTFPTYQNNSDFNFFYGNRENVFWSIIEQVYSHHFNFHNGEAAIEERKRFLDIKRLGIIDMHAKCYRKNHMSTDENLYPIILTDIFSELDNHSTINKLILTSRTPIIGALGLLQTYFLQQGRVLADLKINNLKIKEGSFRHNEREIEITVPYSPSPRLFKDGITTFSELVNMYRHSLLA